MTFKVAYKQPLEEEDVKEAVLKDVSTDLGRTMDTMMALGVDVLQQQSTSWETLHRFCLESTSILGSVPFDEEFLLQKQKLVRLCLDWLASSNRHCAEGVFRSDVLDVSITPPPVPLFYDSQFTPNYYSGTLLECAQKWWTFLDQIRPVLLFLIWI